MKSYETSWLLVLLTFVRILPLRTLSQDFVSLTEYTGTHKVLYYTIGVKWLLH